MRLGLVFKILLLVLLLVGVFAAMKGLTPGKMQNAFQALGIEPGAAGSPGLQPSTGPLQAGEERRTLCRTRIHALRFADGKSIVEVRKGLKMDWVAEDSADKLSDGSLKQTPLNYMAVEKWLSQHCQYSALPMGPSGPTLGADGKMPVLISNAFLLIEFIDGKTLEIQKAGDILVSGSAEKGEPLDRFQSPDLEAALVELRQIAGFR